MEEEVVERKGKKLMTVGSGQVVERRDEPIAPPAPLQPATPPPPRVATPPSAPALPPPPPEY